MPLLVPRRRGKEQALAPSGETYLLLGELDLDDADAITEFASSCGVLHVTSLSVDPYFEHWLARADKKARTRLDDAHARC